MSQIGAFKIRLPLDPFNFTARQCLLQVAIPKMWRGVPVDIQVGVYSSGVFITDISNFVSINMEIHPLTPRAGATLVSKQVLVAQMSTITEANWINGSAQHATFSLTSADTNFDLTGSVNEQLSFFMVFWADIGSSSYPTLGFTTPTVIEDAANLSLAAIGSSSPNFRVDTGMHLQVKNKTTGKWHTIFFEGTDGNEQLAWEAGES